MTASRRTCSRSRELRRGEAHRFSRGAAHIDSINSACSFIRKSTSEGGLRAPLQIAARRGVSYGNLYEILTECCAWRIASTYLFIAEPTQRPLTKRYRTAYGANTWGGITFNSWNSLTTAEGEAGAPAIGHRATARIVALCAAILRETAQSTHERLSFLKKGIELAQQRRGLGAPDCMSTQPEVSPQPPVRPA